MAEEIDFENGHFRNFQGLVTLTLTLDDLESHISRFVSSTSIHTYIVILYKDKKFRLMCETRHSTMLNILWDLILMICRMTYTLVLLATVSQ